MKHTRWLILALTAALLLGLAGCGETGTAVYVQSVSELSGLGGIAPGDRFAGVVVSENEVQITKDEDKAISELLVKAGDTVQAGQTLFTYDTEQLQLNLDRLLLEKDQLEATIENYKQQITDLENERSWAPAGDKLQYTIQIQSTQLDLKEAELNLDAKNTEIAQAEAILENAAVTSPVDGRVQSVSENGFDNYGNPLPYITIQQSGSYRVKGVLGELQMGVIMEGVRIRIISRTDESQTWGGTVSFIDYESPSQGSDYDMYYGTAADEMTSASKYPFYIELDSTEGLLLGQHVYLELETDGPVFEGVSIPASFIAYDDNGAAYVWADRRGKLEQRSIVLGEYNMTNDTYQILSGLDESDSIAFPDSELCHEGAPTTSEQTVMNETPESGVG